MAKASANAIIINIGDNLSNFIASKGRETRYYETKKGKVQSESKIAGQGKNYIVMYKRNGRYYRNQKTLDYVQSLIYGDHSLEDDERDTLWSDILAEVIRLENAQHGSIKEGVYRTQGRLANGEKGFNRVDITSILSRIQENKQLKFITNMGYQVDELADEINSKLFKAGVDWQIDARFLLDINNWHGDNITITDGNRTFSVHLQFTYNDSSVSVKEL